MNLFNNVLGIFSNDLAVDLGTANTLIYIRGKGIVLDEPSVVTVYKNGGRRKQILAVGTEAKKMLGKTPDSISAIRPMREGVIADFEIAGFMLRHFIRKVCSKLNFLKPKILIAVPSGINRIEKNAVEESAGQAGAKDVFLIEEPVAAAIGADLPITEPICNMVVDIGGGTTGVAVISLSGIVCGKRIKIAGDKMDAAIMHYVKRKYNLLIGENTAEDIKIKIGNVYPEPGKIEVMNVKGRENHSGMPKIIQISSEDVQIAISEQTDAIIETVKSVLEQMPPEFAADIIERGIILTGGGALLKNLDKLIQDETNIPVRVAKSPLLTVALGSGKTLDNHEMLRQVKI